MASLWPFENCEGPFPGYFIEQIINRQNNRQMIKNVKNC